MRKNIFFYFILLCLNISSLFASHNGSLFWKISGNGLHEPSYVLGISSFETMQVINQEKIYYILNNTEALLTEVLYTQEFFTKLFDVISMPKDRYYEELLGDNYAFVKDRFAKDISTPIEAFEALKPKILAYHYISTIYNNQARPSEPEIISMDTVIQDLYNKNNKSIIAIENENEYFESLFDMSLEEEAKELICILKNHEKIKIITKELHEAYLDGDISKINILYQDQEIKCQNNIKPLNVLNKAKNDKWMNKILSTIKENPSFIILEAPYLGGKSGILEELEKLGYKVEAFDERSPTSSYLF